MGAMEKISLSEKKGENKEGDEMQTEVSGFEG
jgi:hypothetical protein